MEEMKPCPFCGAELIQIGENRFEHPDINFCVLSGLNYFSNIENSNWNERVEIIPNNMVSKKEIEQLEKDLLHYKTEPMSLPFVPFNKSIINDSDSDLINFDNLNEYRKPFITIIEKLIEKLP